MNTTTTCCLPTALLESADSLRLRAYFTDEVPDALTGLKAMDRLRSVRPDIADEVLCLLYDVACYQVTSELFPDAPKSEHGKWFASTPVESRLGQGVEVPLADTLKGAQELAVRHLMLRESFSGS